MSSPASPVLATSDTPAPSPPSASEASQFRVDVGLRADASWVAQSLSDQDTFSVRQFNGVPLTAAEGAEIERRILIQQGAAAARDWASMQPGSAGGYTDQAAGGVMVFTFAGDPEPFRSQISRLLPAGTPFRLERVARSLDDLYALKAAVRGRWADLEAEGIDILDVGLNPMLDAVTVSVIGLTPTAEARLYSVFPSGVVVEEAGGPAHPDSCDDRKHCGSPIKGGIEIKEADGGQCTSGYIAELNNSTPATLRVVTAGHCIEKHQGIGGTWKHNGVAFGTATVETWENGADGDVGVITLANTGAAANLFYASANWDIRHFTSWATLTEVDVNDFFCRSGVNSGYLCGRVTDLDKTLQVENRLIDHQNKVDYDAVQGDSGGPYWFGSKLYGIHSDSWESPDPLPKRAWYTPYVWASIVVSNVHICLTTSC